MTSSELVSLRAWSVLVYMLVFWSSTIQAEEECFQQNIPFTNLNKVPGNWMNIFLDLSITCDETQIVAGWKFYANKTGAFYADVWRPAEGEDQSLVLVGSNKIDVTQPGVQEVLLDGGKIFAQNGDVIGIHYDPSGGGVIPYEDARNGMCCGLTDQDMTRFHRQSDKGEFPEGKMVAYAPRSYKVLPALQPILEPANPDTTECFQTNMPIMNLNTMPGRWMKIFLDMSFKCSEIQMVRGWRFYANQTGAFYADVWRPVEGEEKSIRLVGSNKIDVTQTGPGEVFLDNGSQIVAQAGDVIGIHYDKGAPVVIPFEDEREGMCCGLTEEDMSRFYHEKTFGELAQNFLVNYYYYSYKMLPALQPIVETVECDMTCFDEFNLFHVSWGMPLRKQDSLMTICECREACANNQTCVGFDFNRDVPPYLNASCWLHSEEGTLIPPDMDVSYYWRTC